MKTARRNFAFDVDGEDEFAGLSTDYDSDTPVMPEDVGEFDDEFGIAPTTPIARPDEDDPEPHVAPEFKVANVLAKSKEDERRDEMRRASKSDRRRQAQANTREYLRAAFTGDRPQLRNLGTSNMDALLKQYQMQPKPADPMEQERKLLELQKLRDSLKAKSGNPLDDDYKRQLTATQRALEQKYLREPTERPARAVDEEMRAADVELKRARADYLKRPKGGAKGSGPDGKSLAAAQVLEMADFETSKDQLRRLGKDFERYDVSGVGSKALAWGSEKLGLSNDYTEFMDRALLAMQGVGKIMEGGKLQAGDETKYKSLLPRPGDSTQRAEAKIAEAISFLDSLRDNRIKALSKAGFRTGDIQSPVPTAPEADVQVGSDGKKYRELPDGSFEEVP